ncbi:MAG: hypothetical protein M1470_12035 [Bacteroidetes bacterium]|nr:hypothetical protein [Bacteroidota bacterium]MCL5737189.1 hypothetical protein [Bacteroidota bacterium]
MSKEKPKEFYHRFLDEAGDTTFWGKGKTPIIGKVEGVSLCFILGMVKFKRPLSEIRSGILSLQNEIENDEYYQDVPSIQKKKEKVGYYFHATDDLPEVREKFYKYIRTIDLSFEAAVGRKIYDVFTKKHNSNEEEFYGDLLSHLLKNKLELGGKLILTIAERGKSTRNINLTNALLKAKKRFKRTRPQKEINTDIVFNIQNPTKEPLLTIPDYLCWAVQRVFERGETRYYNFIEDKISLIVDLYDSENYGGHKNYYNERHKLTSKNKLSPP